MKTLIGFMPLVSLILGIVCAFFAAETSGVLVCYSLVAGLVLAAIFQVLAKVYIAAEIYIRINYKHLPEYQDKKD